MEKALSDYLRTHAKKKKIWSIGMHIKMVWCGPSRSFAHRGVEMQLCPRYAILSLFIVSVVVFCFTRMTPPPRREQRPEKPRARRQNELSEKNHGLLSHT